jgi:hypothetical protein
MKKYWFVLLILIAVAKVARDGIIKADSQKNDLLKEAGINLPFKTESGVILKDTDEIINAMKKGGILTAKEVGSIRKKIYNSANCSFELKEIIALDVAKYLKNKHSDLKTDKEISSFLKEKGFNDIGIILKKYRQIK